jgi:malate dehydrogenase (quinone)
MENDGFKHEVDVILIGAGIMSATLGVMLRELHPGINIEIFERLDKAAAESSDAWNNAGTGHSAFCELNYTPEQEDGSIDITKAVNIAESFEESRQFWSYLIRRKLIELPDTFIRSIPHMSFVWGEKNIDFLKKRYDALTNCHLFKGMRYSEDREEIASWIPLMMEGRDPMQRVAATRMDIGTDVNFGSLTRCMFKSLVASRNVNIHFNYEVRSLRQDRRGVWRVMVKDRDTEKRTVVHGRFVFIGAGGGALPLLLKSGIKEGKGFGGFPVSGQWLRCTNPEVVERHNAKVYGLASVGAPPMSVPHLDTRIIKGKRELLYGPFAGFTTKFLKKGSIFDLVKSMRFSNLWPMLAAGVHNIPLTKYLIDQVKLTQEQRIQELRLFLPNARPEDWVMEIAGQRVQVIKKDEEEGGILQFGTEVVSGADGSLAALLGASPGASTAVTIMLKLLKKCFPKNYASDEWQSKLREMLPSFGRSLGQDEHLLREIREYTQRELKLQQEHVPGYNQAPV